MRALGPALLFAGMVAAAVLVAGELYHGVMVGSAVFLVYRTLVVRTWLLRDHSRGVHAVKDGDHAAGLQSFVDSEAVWAARPMLDRYRGLVLGSASQWPFLSQAQYNQALCLFHLGRTVEAADVLSTLLEREPKMLLARSLSVHIASQAPAESADWSDLHSEGG